MAIVLTIIALQQGLFAAGWWVAGVFLGLSRRATVHWGGAALASAVALGLILQRGRWPDLLTIVVANVLAMGAFVGMRRGVQVFLRRPTTDREALVLLAAVVVALGSFVANPANARFAVLATSALMAWTLLRCAWETHQTLLALGDRGASWLVAAPIALLGGIYALRFAVGLVWPDIAARPVNDDTGFNAGIVVSFLVSGLLLNMVLAYLVANRLVRRLHQLSIRDPLTGLLNRRGLAPRLARESLRWQRHGERYALLVVDVDHFKQINDRHGHAVGDSVLVRLAALLHELARDADAVARLGGEEFCLLLTRCDADGAAQVAERLRQQVRSAPWPQLGAPLTVSVGVALADSPDTSTPAVMARADAALLRAKAAGRDRVEVALPEPA